MGEKRAVRVSHELWKQIMTQGYVSSGYRCIEGLPEDARFVTAFPSYTPSYPDAVFIFESDDWGAPVPEHTTREPYTGEIIPVMDVVFRAVECRTCKGWDIKAEYNRSDLADIGDCQRTTGRYRSKMTVNGPIQSVLSTDADFGCTQYEPRETDD